MSNEQKQTAEEQVKDATTAQVEEVNKAEEEITETKADLIDEVSQANFRIEELEKELAAAQEKAKTEEDKAMRAIAEEQNVRRRAALDVESARKKALKPFVDELLPVIDNMERAISSAGEDEATKAVVEGVELTLKSLLSAVTKFGVETIDPQGEKFNPELHQAISMVPNPEHPKDTVIMVMQKGYTLNGLVLRPAMVMVSQG